MPHSVDTTDWVQWSKYVVEGMKSLHTKVDHLEHEVSRLHTRLSMLKQELAFKSGVWGMFAGAIPVLIWLAFNAMRQQ